MRAVKMSITLSRTEVETLLPYMRDVTRCEMSLRELNLMWSLIEASAKMNCPQDARTILPTMAATRTQFGQMERDLVSSLVLEKLRNAIGQVQTRAQYVIDIVVRNLYERTADVGFLATDPDLCHFVANPVEDEGRIGRRLQEYRHKVHRLRRDPAARHRRPRARPDRQRLARRGQPRPAGAGNTGQQHLPRNLPRHRPAPRLAAGADLLAAHAAAGRGAVGSACCA